MAILDKQYTCLHAHTIMRSCDSCESDMPNHNTYSLGMFHVINQSQKSMLFEHVCDDPQFVIDSFNYKQWYTYLHTSVYPASCTPSSSILFERLIYTWYIRVYLYCTYMWTDNNNIIIIIIIIVDVCPEAEPFW